MTAQAAPAPPIASRTLGEIVTSIPLRPVEGWLSLIASAVMVGVVAGALLDAGWTGKAGDARFLPWVGLIGLAFGIGGAKVGWGRWRTHLVGALFGGIVLPLIVGGVALAETGVDLGWSPHDMALRLVTTLDVVRNVWTDLVVYARPVTTEINHYHLVFGVLVWGAGMLAGFTVFGHRRPLDAVVVLGLVLLANMAMTSHDQLPHLVTFSAASLLLLIRTHVFEEEVTWSRRKIGDPAAVGQLYLGGGAGFVTVAILGAVVLTFAASSAPLQGVWQDLPRYLQSVTQWLQRFAPPGDYRGLGLVTFGDNAVTRGEWNPSNGIAFRAQFPRTETEPFKWRAGTFSEYTGFGWNWGPTRSEATGPGVTLLGGDPNGDMPITTDRRQITIEVRPDAFIGNTVISPSAIVSVDRSANALVLGSNGWFTTVEANGSLRTYNVTALVPVFEAKSGGITEPALRAAGTDYPEEIRRIYINQLPAGAVGPDAAALLTAIRNDVKVPSYADKDNPYDLARTMEAYLRSDANFTYDDNVIDERNAHCKDASTVECFARIRRGYCDYYASTMAVLLRASGVPARVAYGFLPGVRDSGGLETVGASKAHYWVEVYFPGIGWIEFDPTGGGRGGPVAPIPSGSPIPATPKPSGPVATFSTRTNPPSSAGPGGPGTSGPGSDIGPFIAIALILLVGAGALALASIRRTPSRPMHPDQAWGSVARLASRLGLGPKPSQTVYEYAGSLGDAVPAARVELTTIARAKVEVAYGRRDLGSDRLKNIAIAYQRLRFALLGVLMRRPFRRGPKRR